MLSQPAATCARECGRAKPAHGRALPPHENDKRGERGREQKMPSQRETTRPSAFVSLKAGARAI